MKKRIMSVLLIAVMAIGLLSGCGKKAEPASEPAPAAEQKAEPKAETKKEEPKAEAIYTPGEYSGSGDGFGGEIKVTMTFSEDKITDVKIVGDKETESVGGRAVAELPETILAAQSADFDGVSGATISSNAIKAAVAACIAQAKGEAEAGNAAKMAPGTYNGEGLGFRVSLPVKVAVTVTEDKITDIVVDQQNTKETDHILQSVVDLMIPRMLEQQSIAVDAITGATASSNAVKTAVESAVAQALAAGGSDASAIAAFKVKAEKLNKQTTIDTDVLVVGMGGSGTAAALSAAENGAKVLCIDKAGKYGGTSVLTSGPMAINPPSQVAAEIPDWTNPATNEKITKKAGDKLVDEEEFYNTWLEYTTIDGIQTAKPEMVRIMIDESGKTIDWLGEWGFQFGPAQGFVGNKWAVYTPHYGNKALTQGFFDQAYDRFQKEFGGQYMLETEAYDLIKDDNGAICGVRAVNVVDGTEYRINAKAVILATGGFAGSAEMEKKYLRDDYYPLKGEWNHFGMRQNDGKMIQAAIDNGAATYNISVPPMVHVGGVKAFLTGYEAIPALGFDGKPNGNYWSHADIPLHMAISANTLAVGKDAKRFSNESSISMLNPWIAGPNFYSIWSTEQVEKLITDGFDAVPPGPSTSYLGYGAAIPAKTPLADTKEVLDKAIEAGYVFKADTIEELAKKVGLDPAALAATVDAYNGFCETGVDTEFGKAADQLVKIGAGPYYAIVGASHCYSTCGGLDVNVQFQALDEGGAPIKGLYVVGTDSMGVLFSEAKAYVTYGGAAMGYAYTSGKLAGQYAAESIK